MQYIVVQSDYHKVRIPVDEIMYITMEGRKTKISKVDGSAVLTNKSLRDVYGDLPGDVFSSVNRGIVVSKTYIKGEKDGVLTMRDGTKFKRRVRTDRAQKPRMVPAAKMETRRDCPAEELGWWLGGLPMPMCILELVYRRRGGSAALVVRYCNPAMAQLEDVKESDILGQPVTKLKGLGKERWLTAFADVAINGGSRVLEDVWDETGQYLRVHCYQPQSGCCALVMTDLTRENNLVQKLFHRERET